jgi:uncharacterized membrane protein YbaN (DUF454 family)
MGAKIMRKIGQQALWAVGTLSVLLGLVGTVVPLLPTTPFLLLGAACYARSSRRFHHWLLASPHLGSYIRAYHEGRGLPARTKALTIAALWLSIGYAAIFVATALPLRLLLAAIAVGVTIHLLSLPTLCQQPPAKPGNVLDVDAEACSEP